MPIQMHDFNKKLINFSMIIEIVINFNFDLLLY